MGLGRGIGLLPVDGGGGVEPQGGEEEREGIGGTGFGRGIGESNAGGLDGVGAGVAGERGVCLGEQEEGKGTAVPGVAVPMMVAGCAGTGAPW